MNLRRGKSKLPRDCPARGCIVRLGKHKHRVCRFTLVAVKKANVLTKVQR